MKIKRRIIIIIFILLALFFSPTFSKYRNNTITKIIRLFTRYNVTYVTTGGTFKNLDDFSSYLSINGLVLPTEDDIDRKGYDLYGWYENNSFIGDPITKIE